VEIAEESLNTPHIIVKVDFAQRCATTDPYLCIRFSPQRSSTQSRLTRFREARRRLEVVVLDVECISKGYIAISVAVCLHDEYVCTQWAALLLRREYGKSYSTVGLLLRG